jgi:hypothetical protein
LRVDLPTLGEFQHVESDVTKVPDAVRLGLLDIQTEVAHLLAADGKRGSSNIIAVNKYLLSLLTAVELKPRGDPVSSVDIVLVDEKFEAELGKIELYLSAIETRVKELQRMPAALADDPAPVVRPSKALAALAEWKGHFRHLKNGERSVSVGRTCVPDTVGAACRQEATSCDCIFRE